MPHVRPVGRGPRVRKEPEQTIVVRQRRARSFIGLLLGVVLAGCDAAKPKPASPGDLKIVVSGDTAGWITPCGCTSNQSGGLLRRGSFLAGLPETKNDRVLYLDAGGAVHGNSEYDVLKIKVVLDGERLMGIAAHNLGRAEAALGVDTLRRMGRANNPLVSCNVRDADGKLVAEPLRTVDRSGRHIAITGVLWPQFAPAGLRVDEPRQAVLDVAAKARGTYDVLIVLAYMPQDDLEKLAAGLPEADAVIGGPTGQPIPPRSVGPTLVTSATNKGKFLAVLDLPPKGPPSGRIVELDQTFPDDPAQKENLGQFLAELERRDLSPAQTGLALPLPPGAPADYRVAGSESCAKCHSAEFSTWQHTAHSHAWQTLAPRHFEVDPECMQCHTTGYGLPGGFATRATTMHRVSVGCESCHGPSAAHVADPHRRTPFRAGDQCTQCHDHENSPKFDFASYWPRIRHGPATQPAGNS